MESKEKGSEGPSPESLLDLCRSAPLVLHPDTKVPTYRQTSLDTGVFDLRLCHVFSVVFAVA